MTDTQETRGPQDGGTHPAAGGSGGSGNGSDSFRAAPVPGPVISHSDAPEFNPVAPAPEGARTAADVVTPELAARLGEGALGSGRTISHTPFTGKKLAELPESTPEDVAFAFHRAREAQRSWAARPVRERARVLLRFHDLVLKRRTRCWT